MKLAKALSAAFFFFLGGSALAADPVWEWVQVVGGAGEDRGTGVAVNQLGLVYFAGLATGGSVGTTAISGNKYFVTTLGATGNVSQVYLGTGAGGAMSLVNSPDGGIAIAGSFKSTLTFGSQLISPIAPNYTG